MVLSKITCHGFKSFAKKLELHFDGRITAVVGPNGCGKTNIVDAIRWGLGEQRPSVLRTDKMESVIFSGARSSKPLGMAEVSVIFDNSKHLLPIDFSEVMITRRLYRSGESEYLINKSSVRLKDVHDLLMDTGMGTDAYSVIELKMVEDILSDKDEDRRKLLEEAAGVTKYKHRLKAAIRKLESTRTDLLRVNDIIQEVDRTVSSLHRQVHRAKRYQELFGNVKTLELRRAVRLLDRFRNDRTPLAEELDRLQQQRDGRTTTITKEEADVESLKADVLSQEKKTIEVRELLADVVERIHRREGDIRVGHERIASLRSAIERSGQEIELLKKRLEDQNNHLQATVNERESFQAKITGAGRLFNNKKKELEVFQQGLNLKRLELNGKKKEIIGCLESINRLGTEETQLRTRIDNNQGRLERLDEEDAEFRSILEKSCSAQKESEEAIQKLKAERARFGHARDKADHEERNLVKALEKEREQFFRDQGELELLVGKLGFLRNVVENREGLMDGAKKLLKDNLSGMVGVLADVLETHPDHRQAVEIGLGEAAHYLVFHRIEQLFGALRHLRQTGGGRVAMVALDRISGWSGAGRRPKISGEWGGLGWADELVRCGHEFRDLVGHLLGDLYIVRDWNAAQDILERVGDGNVRIATLDGELVSSSGVLKTSESSEMVGMVGRRDRIKEFEDRIGQRRSDISRTEIRIRDLENRRTAARKEKEDHEKSLQGIETRVVDEEKQHSRVVYDNEKADQGITKDSVERQKILGEIENGRNDLENNRPKMDILLEKREQLETASGQIQVDVDRLEEEEKTKEDEVHRLNVSLVRMNGEAKNLDYDIERSGELIREIEQTITRRADEATSAKTRIEEIDKETLQNTDALTADFTERNGLESQIHEHEQVLQGLTDKLKAREKEIREVRKDRDEASERIHTLEMEIQEVEHRMKTLGDRLKETYDMDVTTLPDDGVAMDLDAAEQEIEDIKRKIKVLGPVNLVALQEYDQEKARFDFLTQQRGDLVSAETTLKETITKINETARQRFIDVFDKVRSNFKETFGLFFQGGEADLRLLEGTDPLEAPVEIVARPAGKHFRDLTLLSGGERALTAISLLFALYLVKPSPFCILDEIDAPLDDANVERFTRVLSEFSRKTQFIIVTHNKMTMKAAQALYGVTMEEEGVSKIVSVKFQEENNS